MKRLISIFFTFMFLSFYFNTVIAFATPQSRTLTQGIYSVRDTNLLVGAPLTISLSPATSKALILVVDSDQVIQSLVRLNPQVQKQTLPALDYDYSLIILTNGKISFT